MVSEQSTRLLNGLFMEETKPVTGAFPALILCRNVIAKEHSD